MTVNEKLARKSAMAAAFMLVAFCLPALMAGISAAVEDGSETVSSVDPVTIVRDGEAVETDAFECNGVIYAVTVDTEAEEEVGVYGVSENLPQSGVAMVLCSVAFGEDDDKVTYPVKTILSEFSSNCAGATSLILAETVTSFGKDCLQGLDFGTLVVSNEIENPTDLKEQTGYGGSFIKMEDSTDMFTFVFHQGEIDYPEFKNQDDCSQKIPLGITVSLLPCEGMFTYPYYAFCGWAVEGDDEVKFDDCDSITCFGGNLYVNGEITSPIPSEVSVNACWEEEDAYGDYQPWQMWATTGIILVLAILGLCMVGYRAVFKRRSDQ